MTRRQTRYEVKRVSPGNVFDGEYVETEIFSNRREALTFAKRLVGRGFIRIEVCDTMTWRIEERVIFSAHA